MNATLEHLGRIDAMPPEEYHAIDAISQSGLKRLKKSPWHYRSLQIEHGYIAGSPNPQMYAGTLAHCALLEPLSFNLRYVVGPEGATKQSRKWKEFCAQNPEREVISQQQYDIAHKQAENVKAHPKVAQLLAHGSSEVSVFWKDKPTGVLCKGRMDWVNEASPKGVILLDYKTASDGSFMGFSRAVANLGYHLQNQFYAMGYEAATGKPVLGMVFAVVEAEYPFAVSVFMLDDEALARAASDIRNLLNVYAQCLETNSWPGYPADVQVISLPSWAQ